MLGLEKEEVRPGRVVLGPATDSVSGGGVIDNDLTPDVILLVGDGDSRE